MSIWERRKILIWGKTRPELSKNHKETVCTGGVFEDTKEFVRLYPIPLRYLDDERYFKKYQWIEADIRKAIRDSRPESYNIRCDSIQIGETILSENGDWSRRAEWIIQPGHIFSSVTALQEARDKVGTSIGMVKPDEVLDFSAEPYPDDEKRQFWSKYAAILAQQELVFEPADETSIKPISPPDFRFKIRFRSEDKEHEFGVFDWEADALYFRCTQKGDTPKQACEKVISKLRDEVCSPAKDTYFFLGNIASHPHRFTIVGLWYPKRRKSVQKLMFS